MTTQLKMYILVRDAITGFAPVAIAHASLATYLKFQDHPDVKEWLKSSFKKVVCWASDEEIATCINTTEDWVEITESKANGVRVAIGFRPRTEWPKFFSSLRLM